MTRTDAYRIATMFAEIGGFSAVKVNHFGFVSTAEQAAASTKWEVELWSVNDRAGNRNLTTISSAAEVPDAKAAKRVARVAKGKTTAADKAAMSRMVAERAVNQE